MTYPPIVEELRKVLGSKLTAYMVGRKSTNMDNLTPGELIRLADAYWINRHMQTARPPHPAWDPVTLRSWWMGMNSMLGDESPATHVRDGDFDTVWQAAQHDYIS